MIRLQEILFEGVRAEIVSMMKKHFDDCSRKYFKKQYRKYPYPNFMLKTNNRSAGSYIPHSNTFKLDLDFASGKRQLKSTMYHETIHYYQTEGGPGFNLVWFRLNGYHDDEFKKMMKKINSGEGDPDLVTISTNYKAIRNVKSKPYWVYVIKKGTDYGMFWAAKREIVLIERIKQVKDNRNYKEAYVFQTDNPSLKEFPRMRAGTKKITWSPIKKTNSFYKNFTNIMKRSHLEKVG